MTTNHEWLKRKIKDEMGLEFDEKADLEIGDLIITIWHTAKGLYFLNPVCEPEGVLIEVNAAYQIIAAAFELEQAEKLVLKKRKKLQKKLEGI